MGESTHSQIASILLNNEELVPSGIVICLYANTRLSFAVAQQGGILLKLAMRIPDEYLECVAFLGARPENIFTPVGTVFLFGREEQQIQRTYAVTAKHVIEGL